MPVLLLLMHYMGQFHLFDYKFIISMFLSSLCVCVCIYIYIYIYIYYVYKNYM